MGTVYNGFDYFPPIFNNDGMAEFRSFLRELRSAKGLSIGQLSVYSGISKATLSRWEAGINSPRIPELFRVLEALEASSAMVSEALGLLEQPRAIQAAKTTPDSAGYLSVGDLLLALRSREGLSQEEVARRCGIYRTQYRKWENDDSRPSTHQLQAAAFVMGASPEEIHAISTMSLSSMPLEKDRESLFAVFYSFFSWEIGFTRAMRQLQLLTLYAGMLQLYKAGKASTGDLALLICEFGTVVNIWSGSIAKRDAYFVRAKKLAERSHEPLNLHVVPALQEKSPEDLLAWSPAFATAEGKAYLMSHVARRMAKESPDRAIQMGTHYCQLVEHIPWEYPCRLHDFGNLLIDCGKYTEAVDFFTGLEVRDSSRRMMQFLDLARAYIKLGSQNEARICLDSALQITSSSGYGFVNRAIASIQSQLS
ncbi:MAG: helix-turn-helix transcriptional regulator [Armatimonas sp.]